MQKEEVTTISEIAYDVNPHLGYTVFIYENGEYVPYLVLTNNYNSNTLLLRKYLLDELMPYYPNPTGHAGFASYYGDSPLGHYLNDEFFYYFSINLQGIIVNSIIEITARHSLRSLANNDIETIERRVFLLSRHETGGSSHRRFMMEGARFNYFSTQERFLARRLGGEPVSWWIRTPSTGGTPGEAGVVTHLGVHTTASVYTILGATLLGVRPAFCLPTDTPVRQGELDGELVFFIDY